MIIKELLKSIKNITNTTGMGTCGRDRIRELVRIHYNHTCQSCGKKWNIGARRFDIHHMDCKKEKTKQVDTNEDISNLLLLCHKCHLNLPEHKKSMMIGRKDR